MEKIEKNKLIEKVKGLEDLSNDEKAALIGYIKTKTYGLVWEDSTEKVWEQLKDYIPVLTEDKSKTIINDTDDQKNPNHILIEGDNLLALTDLCFTHEGKVDVIYIDPPYNTGNKDFAYYDDFCDEYRQIPYVDKEDSYRHSKWLSFMEKRLKIAKTLLSGKGVIFISIDDNELSQIKMLCDEIFNEKNFVANLIWKSKSGGAHDSTAFGVDHEYILCYAKDFGNISLNNDKEAAVTTSYNKIDADGRRYSLDRLDKQSLGYVASLDFPIIGPDGREYVIEHKNPDVKKARWRWGKDTVKERYDELVFIYPYVYTKNYEKEDGQKPRSILVDERFGRTRTGSTDLAAVIGKQNIFSYPKPIALIKYILSISTSQSSIILDFFAGSGTTLHATMKLNTEDGGHRQCIIITNNENNICEKITYVRNQRVINGYKTPKGEHIEGLKKNNLRYFKVGFVPREKDLANIERFARQSVNLLCIKEDVYKEQTRFGELDADGFRYFKDGAKQFLVILEPEMIEPIIEELTKMDYEGKMPVYVFTTGHYPYTEDFWQVSGKVELYPYPSCIYGACEKVMPKMEDKLLDLPDNVELSDEEANMTFEDLNKE